MNKVRIGLVGAGFIAGIHMDAFRAVTGIPVEVVGVAASRLESAEAFARRYGIPRAYGDYRELVDDGDIDAVDVCVPNVLHRQVCVDAAEAGKHIICEKPLTGAFGAGPEAGSLPRRQMYEEAMRSADEILAAARCGGVKVCYAEDYIYAPPVLKAKRLIKQAGGTILEIRSEESHSGSHAAYSRQWHLAGGGSLSRLGSHPLGVLIHLKRYEGLLKAGKPIGIKSVLADVGTLTKTEAFKRAPGQWLVKEWVDVEDWATVVLTFEDGTKGLVLSNDITLGGVVNTLEVYTTNCVVKCNMSTNDAVMAYAPVSEVFGDEYITEKAQTKAGWSFPSSDEFWTRGYPQEMQDFVEAICYDRDPVSDGELGRQVVQAIYAAYLSAELGRRIDLAELDGDVEKAGAHVQE